MTVKTKWTLLLLSALSSAIVLAIACGTPEIVLAPPTNGTPGDTDGGWDGYQPPITFDASGDVGRDAQTAADFELRPANLTRDLSTTPMTIQYTAVSKKTGQPVVPDLWYLDSLAAGTIDSTGLFTASSKAGGVITIFAEAGRRKASTTLSLRMKLSENEAGIDTALQERLRAGSAGAGAGNQPDGSFRWLYPYDKTVFPRGLLPPTLQFAGTRPAVLRLHIKSIWFEYEGFFLGSNPARLPVATSLWQALTASAVAQDPVEVSVTKSSGNHITGPIQETWHVAQGSLQGFVYYNTYEDPLATGNGQVIPEHQGAVMRIRPGQARPDLLLGGDGTCSVCHSVSANGSVMALSAHHACNQIYNLSPSGGPATRQFSDRSDCTTSHRHDDTFSFAALTPDGSLMLSSGSMSVAPDAPDGTGGEPKDFYPNIASVDDDTGPRDSKLYDTKTGQIIPTPSFETLVKKAITPSFSPDGKRIAFMQWERTAARAITVMDFDASSRTFSNLRDVYDMREYDIHDGYAAWPAFLPDGQSLIFQFGGRRDYSSWREGSGELLITDLNRNDDKLHALNGVSNGRSYLGNEKETRMSYEPTVLPVAVGGFYWVVFTSRRAYGNIITSYGDTPDPPAASPKKLWVAAIDIHRTPGRDPSHPAFYLEGQSLQSGNMRGFWALEPCRQNGNSCESGSECCEGFCRAVANDAGTTSYVCVPPPPDTCAEEFEACTTAADCCDPTFECINGHCARNTPVIR